MGLRGNKGLKYFPLVTDFFQDRDVRRLMLCCGEAGVLLYIYILCATYAKSYYLKWDEDMLMDASLDLRCQTQQLEATLNYLLEKGFFDRELFEQRGLLSSKAVQRQFQECARAMRRKCVVDRQAWLLDDDETCQYVLFEKDKTVKNQSELDIDCQNPTQKKGKEKEKKPKESKGDAEMREQCVAMTGRTAASAPAGAEEGPLLSQPAADSFPPEGGSLDPVVSHYKEKMELGGRGEEELREYCRALGPELCIFALERALEQDKPHWSYVRAILRSYRQQGYTQVSQAKDEQARHRQSYGRDNYGFRGRNVQARCEGYEPVSMEGLKKMYDLI